MAHGFTPGEGSPASMLHGSQPSRRIGIDKDRQTPIRVWVIWVCTTENERRPCSGYPNCGGGWHGRFVTIPCAGSATEPLLPVRASCAIAERTSADIRPRI